MYCSLAGRILVIGLLPTLVAVGMDSDEREAPAPPGKLVDVGGFRLHISCEGRGSPVIMIYGGGSFSVDWSLVQPQVARFAQACTYDRAGNAWSDSGPTPRTMCQDVYELHKLLQKAQIEQPYVLVGHSLGGLIARLF